MAQVLVVCRAAAKGRKDLMKSPNDFAELVVAFLESQKVPQFLPSGVMRPVCFSPDQVRKAVRRVQQDADALGAQAEVQNRERADGTPSNDGAILHFHERFYPVGPNTPYDEINLALLALRVLATQGRE
jgi:hypothetical protein